MRRRTVLQRVSVGIATASSVAFAGCSGDNETADGSADGESTDGGDDEETMEGDGDGGSMDGGDDGSTDGGDDGSTDGESDDSTVEEESEDGSSEDEDAPPVVELTEPAYQFSAGESYTYESEWRGNTGKQGWEVLTVDGDQLTIQRTYPTDEGDEITDVSADAGRIYEEMLRLIPGPSFFRNMREAQVYAGVDEFAPGNTFVVDTSDEDLNWDSETVEVTGETTVNGIDCTEFTITSSSGGIVREVCAAEGYPFPLSLNFEQAGVQLLDATLVDTSRA